MTGVVYLGTGAAPATPAAGLVAAYAKSDNKLYLKDSAGNESPVGGSTGYALLTNSGVQALASAFADNFLTWDTDVDDDLFFYDGGQPTKLTVPTGVSLIQLTGQCGLAFGVTGSLFHLHLTQNGSLGVNGLGEVCASATVGTLSQILQVTSPPIAVVAGDYFELDLTTNDPAATGNTNLGYFSVTVLG